jgi:hypothetical protein
VLRSCPRFLCSALDVSSTCPQFLAIARSLTRSSTSITNDRDDWDNGGPFELDEYRYYDVVVGFFDTLSHLGRTYSLSARRRCSLEARPLWLHILVDHRHYHLEIASCSPRAKLVASRLSLRVCLDENILTLPNPATSTRSPQPAPATRISHEIERPSAARQYAWQAPIHSKSPRSLR